MTVGDNSGGGSGDLKLTPVADRNILAGTTLAIVLQGSGTGSLRYGLDAGPAGASLGPGPTLTWTPSNADVGNAVFTAHVTNGTSTASTSFHVGVFANNRPPQLAAQPDATLEVGSSFARTLTASDPDAGDTLTFALVGGPAGMTLSGAMLSWPTGGRDPGAYNVRVSVTDRGGLSDTRQFVVTLTHAPTQLPPVANDDSYTVQIGQVLSVDAAGGVLANDTPATGSLLVASKLTDPDQGTLDAFDADGSFHFTAPAVLGKTFQPVVKWQVTRQNWSNRGNPRVVPLPGRDAPVIVANFSTDYSGFVVLDGASGGEVWSIGSHLPAPWDDCLLDNAAGSEQSAVADIDDGGTPAIVTAAQCRRDATGLGPNELGPLTRMVALDAANGSVKWMSPPLGGPYPDGSSYYGITFGVTPVIARLHPGESPTILLKRAGGGNFTSGAPGTQFCDQYQAGAGLTLCTGVIGLDGRDGSVRRKWVAEADGQQAGNVSSGGRDAFAHLVVAPIDGACDPCLVANGAVWDPDGNLVSNWMENTPVRSTALARLDDGSTAIVSYELGGEGGLVARRAADASILWKLRLPDPGNYNAGELSVGDLDGDGLPEIVLNMATSVFAINRQGQVLWVHAFPDNGPYYPSVVGTRPAIFDLDGDGEAEVMLQSEYGLEFLHGKDGTVKASIPWTSLGIAMADGIDARNLAPLVADIDGSGHASVVASLPDNYYNGYGNIIAFGAQANDWRPTRPVWGQFSYHVGDIDDDGSVPGFPLPDNFATPATNVFGNQPQTAAAVDPRKATQASFTYAAGAGALMSAPATVTIDITPPNRPPVFVTTPPTRMLVGQYLGDVYHPHAADPDLGDTVTYGVLFSTGDLNGCSIDASTGAFGSNGCQIHGTPYNSMLITATDSFGARTVQTIMVQPSEGEGTVPDVVGEAIDQATSTLDAASFGVDSVSSIRSPAPPGQVLSQHPSGGTAAPYHSTVQLTVSLGPPPLQVPDVVGKPLPAATTQLGGLGFTTAPGYEFSSAIDAGIVMAQSPAPGTMLSPTPANPVSVTVSLGASPPLANIARIDVTPVDTAVVTGASTGYHAMAVYDDGSAIDFTHAVTWTSSAPGIASVDANGVATGKLAGSSSIRATLGAATGSAMLTVKAISPGDDTAPTAAITSPANGATVSGIVAVTGTATDDHFLRYELAVSPSADEAYTLVAQGSVAVSNGTLGSFDPTLLENGAYVLRLSVYDTGGNVATASTTMVVDGSRKVGNFSLSFKDLTVPLPGIAVDITRTYDSRNKASGAFGYGWRLGIDAMRLSTAGVLGQTWEVGLSGGTYSLAADVAHFVSITLPSGRVETFDLALAPTSSYLSQLSTLTASYLPRAGTQGTLVPLDNANLLITDPQPGPVTLLDDTTLDTFNPDRFRYTARDGTQFVVTRSHGVESVTDTSGNTISVTDDGISHSSGLKVAFARDAQGRIVSITDPAGHVLGYGYGAEGDLATSTDRAGNTTRYAYDGRHLLQNVADPLGRVGVRSRYDEDGRLVAITDAAGKTTTYAHDLPGRQETMTDPLGNVTALIYDDRGNVLARTDPLGRTRTMTYDGQDNLVSVTDPMGAMSAFTYDANNDLATSTDPLGRVTRYTHDGAGRVTSRTDPSGAVTTLQYDAAGRLAATVDALGHVRSSTYDASGNLTSSTSPSGATRSNQFDASGRRAAVVDALGYSTALAYDANGNVVAQQAAGQAAWSLQYDANDRIVGTQLGDSPRTVVRDATGAIASVTTVAGSPRQLAYDDAGRVSAVVDPASGAQFRQQSYDANGNVTRSTDALGNTTQFTYDAAGQTTSTTLPGGAGTTTEYDDAGRVIARTDALGRTTRFQYDRASQLVGITDAAGGQWTRTYDANGNVLSETDAGGRTTRYAYDVLGNASSVTYPDGGVATQTYDADGRPATITDPAGHARQFAYDAAGHLASVTNALGQVTRYQYDARGMRASRTDANGNVTRFEYDDHGRNTRIVRPLGDAASATYDAAGHLTSRTNGAGETTLYEFDVRGRLASVTRADGSKAAFTYTADALPETLADERGTSTWRYDAATRNVLRINQPDGRYVRYAYDAVGNRTLVAHGDAGTEISETYDYDALDRVTRVTLSTGEVATFGYDAVGNVVTATLPNGVHASTTYDARNRVRSIDTRDAASTPLFHETYTLDANGNRTRVDLLDGSHVEYRYDALDRVVRELRFDASSTLTADTTMGFDAGGNLVTYGPTAAPASIGYNADGQPVSSGGRAYGYDAAGRRTRESWTSGAQTFLRQYQWDGRDRLVGFSDSSSGADVDYAYDESGERVARTRGGATTTFLVDPNGLGGFSQLLRARAPSGDTTYAWGSSILSTTSPSGVRYHLADALGSTRVLTGASGAVTGTIDYGAAGAALARSGDTAVAHRFVGEQNDDESGLVYLRARYYDPSTATFLSRDPSMGDDNDPLSQHPYLYASGNPVNRVDPSGFETLAELQVTMSDRASAVAQDVINVRRGVITAEQDIAKVMQAAAGILSVEALVESVDNDAPVMKWFGGILQISNTALGKLGLASFKSTTPTSRFFAGAMNTTSTAIALAAEVALMKGATDLFNPGKATYEIQVVPDSAERVMHPGVNDHAAGTTGDTWCGTNEGAHAAAQRDTTDGSWLVFLCRPFFTDTVMPQVGRISMPGVVLHEFMHITSTSLIRDDAYGCDEHRLNLAKPSILELRKNGIPGANLFSADSYRCWVEDVAVGSPAWSLTGSSDPLY